MLSIGDCIAFCGLEDDDELDVLACHEHLPPVIAAAWAAGEMRTVGGRRHVVEILAGRAAEARLRGDFAAADRLDRLVEKERAAL
ncbi:hypothetical protein [Roseospira visakhapatnamensis]|uniref:Uncharacterized protein n=1 Tax=Roseospira visakhapatnamensis TaxID=390880 RepID=A0A7W6W987_9PROT|nr:hypothetical protein [Roseospira visakhapatnamensis]MBB4265221.1 hypothetical protein [Roseospira visakhapatnamensis]